MDIVAKMKRDWNRRAAQHARFWIATEDFQDDARFARSGEVTAAELLERLDGEDYADWSVLEIGCGIGRVLRPLAAHFRRLRGVDVSREMIAQSRDWLAGLSNVHTLEGSGVDLDVFTDAEFDLVYSYVAFQHMPRPVFASYLRETNRVLRPEGRLVFQIPLGAAGDAPLDDTVGLRCYRREELSELLREAGFEHDALPRVPDAEMRSVWIGATRRGEARAASDHSWREAPCPDRVSLLDAHLQLGLADELRREGKLAEAAEAYAALVAADDSAVAIWVAWIEVLVAQRDVGGALLQLERLCDRHPGYDAAWQWRLELLAVCDRRAERRALLREIQQREGVSAELLAQVRGLG